MGTFEDVFFWLSAAKEVKPWVGSHNGSPQNHTPTNCHVCLSTVCFDVSSLGDAELIKINLVHLIE